jgi:HAMP domain-containing protein
MPLYLLAVFGKNEKANITAEEKNHLSKAVKELVAYWRQKNEQSIH